VAARKQSNEVEGKGNWQRQNQQGSVGVVHERRIKNIHISGPMVLSEVLAVAKSLGNDQFEAYAGWLDSFKRHNIAGNLKMCLKV
jgi:hypothetical protein